MKLHKVLISNLNSLYGEHSIDFDQDLKRAPLFLIMGPTGAGKSTILDAICVALFGRTPRLTRAVGKPDQDARHLMSYGTGRCRAEVVFSLKDAEGERHTWRAVWECRRARDKASGNLQDATRSLYKVIDEETEELIVSDNRIKYFEPHFEGVLGGMTVEDFQRSILLAQGEFAAFLKADEQVKASILERLTSTDEYKLIGQRAAKKRREVENRLKELGARLDGLSLLTPQEETELRERVAEQEAVVEATRKDAQQARAARDWIQRHEHFKETIAASTTQRQAAEAQIEAHAEELQALSEDQRCRDAQPILIRAQELARRKVELEALTPELEQSKLDKVKELETQTTIAQDSQSKLDEQRATLDALKPEINRARELHQRIALNQRELDRVIQSASQLSTELTSARATHTSATEELTSLTQQTQANAAAIEALEWSDAQRAALPAFSTSLIQLRDARQSLDERLAQHQASTTRLEGAKSSHQETTSALEAAREAISPQRETLTMTEAALSTFLGESETPERFRQRVQLAQKASDTLLDALDQALSIHETLVERRAAQAELVRQHSSLDRTIKAHASKLEALNTRRTESRAEIAQEQESIARQKHILVLFEHRHTLEEDHACPLCGSEEHPYLRDNATDKKAEESAIAEFEQTRAKLEVLQRREEEIARELHEVELQLASDEATFKHIEKRKQELRQETQNLLTRYNKALESAALATIETFPGKPKDQSDQRDTIIESRTRVKLDAERGEQQLQELAALVTQHQAAQKELELAATQVRELEAKLTRIESEITLREEDQHTRAQDLADAQSRHRAQYEQLSQHLEALAPQMLVTGLAPDLDALQQALTTFQAREEERQQLEAEQTRLASAMRDAHALIARQQEQLERLNASKKELDEDIAARQRELDEARKEQSTLLDGKNPDEVERTHERQIKQTDATLKMALNLQAQARNDFERARTLHEAHENQLREHTQRTGEAQKQLADTLTKLELDSAEALAERLLTSERRSELEALHESLHRELENHKRDLERYHAELAKHEANKPAVQDLFERELDAWSDTTRKLEQELEEHIADLGAVNEKLETQQEAKRRAAEYKDELEALREESNIWEVIYRLIGIKDGGSFKHFAQTLNLQELVDRANVRLKRLAPRYQLAVASGDQGEPRLDFSIRDHHQADTERPLTTLSGGETFLVSLALALALSDFRRVEMPVETLLLDEGFGTLDQETLDLAMATLRQLQQENVQQIGIISHVEGLKERVDTRIVVEKIGNGRSVIKIDAA